MKTVGQNQQEMHDLLLAELEKAATLMIEASRGRITADELSDAGWEARAVIAQATETPIHGA